MSIATGLAMSGSLATGAIAYPASICIVRIDAAGCVRRLVGGAMPRDHGGCRHAQQGHEKWTTGHPAFGVHAPSRLKARS